MELEVTYEALMDKYSISYNSLPVDIKSMIRRLDNAIEDYEGMDDDSDDLREVEGIISQYDSQIKIQIRAFIQKNKEKQEAEELEKSKAQEIAQSELESKQPTQEIVEEKPKSKDVGGILSWMNWK
jgi:hypothetical protein